MLYCGLFGKKGIEDYSKTVMGTQFFVWDLFLFFVASWSRISSQLRYFPFIDFLCNLGLIIFPQQTHPNLFNLMNFFLLLFRKNYYYDYYYCCYDYSSNSNNNNYYYYYCCCTCLFCFCLCDCIFLFLFCFFVFPLRSFFCYSIFSSLVSEAYFFLLPMIFFFLVNSLLNIPGASFLLLWKAGFCYSCFVNLYSAFMSLHPVQLSNVLCLLLNCIFRYLIL